jgi:hypothetical protein
MGQAGVHGIAGLAIRRWGPAREWLALGVVPGNLLPDAGNTLEAVS